MVALLPWVTSILPRGENRPRTPIPAPNAYHTTKRALQTPASAQSGIASLSQGTKIGIIIGVTVIGILSIIGCGLGVLSYRKLQKRRKERKQDRNPETHILESEMKSGQAGQKRNPETGLWDNLKVRVANDEERISPMGNAERVGSRVWDK